MSPDAIIDLQPVIDAALSTLEAACLGPGRYARWLGAERARHAGGADINPYGCADAANILYTTGHFPRNPAGRVEWVGALQAMQDAGSGLFHEATHHTYHVTAHCVAALELFDARPLHPLRGLAFLDEPGGLERFLDKLQWNEGPWNASHQGAGIYAARVICGEAGRDWEERYFSWLWREQDEATGFWRRGCVDTPNGAPLFHHLAGTFHYLFNHEHARRPLRYPAALIDTCLRLRSGNLWPVLGAAIGFSDIDWVYCLTRALRQCGHRSAEVRGQLEHFAKQFAAFLLDRVRTDRTPFDDVHLLFGTLCALAELQTALPGLYRTDRPLHLVLDRRPFI
ncbi:MAG: hypothetical protein WC205_12405 [Opitutaceae bacterium]|jgi:hypothetical protein